MTGRRTRTSRRIPLAIGASSLGAAVLLGGLLYARRDGAPSPSPLSSVDWASLRYPVDCGGQTTGTAAAYPEPEAGRTLAVVFATCATRAGAPPSAVLVYERADSPTSAPVAQTLLRYADNWLPEKDGVTAEGPTLTIPVYGYSTDGVPRCCPDLRPRLTWTWQDGAYTATGPEPEHARLPA